LYVKTTPKRIIIPPDQLAASAFEPVDVALTLMNCWSSRRVGAILPAGAGTCIYLEDGVPLAVG
jgi:hypothetical protein